MGSPISPQQIPTWPLVAATCWLYRLRLSALFDSIQLIAPEFFKSEPSLVVRRPRVGLSIALVLIVAMSHVQFLHTPSAGLQSFLAGRNRPEPNPASGGGGGPIPPYGFTFPAPTGHR